MSSIISFLLLSHFLLFTSANTTLIQKTCQKTKHYDLCIISLKSNPTSSDTDIKGLAQIMARIGMDNATSTSTYLSTVLLSSANDTALKKVLKECADKYSYSSDALRSSQRDLALENYDLAYMHVSAAADYPSACRNAFRRFPGLIYPVEIERREEGLKQICDVVMGIVDYIGLELK